MSVRDRLRPSASLTAPAFAHQDFQAQLSTREKTRSFNRITLSCDDTDLNGAVHREFVFIRGVHRAIDFVRGNSPGAGLAAGLVLQRGDCARAALTSPVMSRRHARLTFVDDGSVVIADVGSMHGTFMAGPNLIGALPDKLKPRRNYTLRDGDVLIFGKPINRDSRDWKPVTIRVTLKHDDNDNASLSQAPYPALSSPSQASELEELRSPYQPRSMVKASDRHSPNRFGMFIDSAGSSVINDDDDSSSSSVSDADSHELSMSSPDSSPMLVPHSTAPLEILNNLAKRASASVAPSAASVSKSMPDDIESWGAQQGDNFESASGFIAPIRPASASESAGDSHAKRASRSIWPVKLASITRLPSLKDLGLFGGYSSNVATPEPVVKSPGSSEKDPLYIEDDASEKEDDVSGEITFALSSPTKSTPVPASAPSSQQDSLSQSRWVEPSFPQNQLGLKLSFGSALGQTQSLAGDIRTETEERRRTLGHLDSDWEGNPFSLSQSGSATPQVVEGDKEQGSEQADEDASAMDISPLPTRNSSPKIPYVSVPDFSDVSNMPQLVDQASTPKERVVVNLVSDDEEQEAKKPVTPKKISLKLPRRSSSQAHHRRRRSKSRSCHEASLSHSQSQALPVSYRELRAAMAHVAETSIASGERKEEKGETIEKAVKELSELVRGFAEKNERGRWVGMEERSEEAVKEVKEMREDMRRLSDLVTTLAEKVSTRQCGNSVRDATVEGSRKRKRDPTVDTDVDSQAQSTLSTSVADSGLNVRIEQLESEILRIQSAHDSTSTSNHSVGLTGADCRPSPAKRSRIGTDDDGWRGRRGGDRLGRSLANATGYTMLGAALAWAALAYAF